MSPNNLKFKDLLEQHPYFYVTANWQDGTREQWATWSDFYDKHKDADLDVNLIIRWDIRKHPFSKKYYMEIFMIRQRDCLASVSPAAYQRRGEFAPHYIEEVEEKDLGAIKELLLKHYEKLQNLWAPFSMLHADLKTIKELLSKYY